MSCIGRNRHAKITTRFCPDCGEEVTPPAIRIHHRSDLRQVAEILGVRPDWHEPDEQEVTAEFGGHSFDNAGFWPEDQCSEDLIHAEGSEQYIRLKKAGREIAIVNLATLFAMAAGTYS